MEIPWKDGRLQRLCLRILCLLECQVVFASDGTRPNDAVAQNRLVKELPGKTRNIVREPDIVTDQTVPHSL